MGKKLNGWHTDGFGTRRHYLYGLLHREDGPAVISPDGYQWWYRKGKPHREDGPAVIFTDGFQRWYRNGKYHREDGPAAIFTDGSQAWWLNNKRVRLEDVLDTPKKREAYLLEESLRRL